MQMFRGPFARWAWSMVAGYKDEPIFVGECNAWIFNSELHCPEARFKGKKKERNHFFNILRHEQLRQDGEA